MTRRHAPLASAAAGTLVAASLTAATLPASAAASGCTVTYPRSYGEGHRAHLLTVTP
ncbi:hypothetical protein [Micromonospora rosaria]|uniref:hypothetical protein n=1 Tax=Micromonospora rosaria TaxID=47874 RepID=UPI000A654268|nr:hypothetical protein [Micromonospora rosaria]